MSKDIKRSQLRELAKPFSKKLIKQKPNSSKADYVSHATITERALHVLGNFNIDSIKEIRGYVAADSKGRGPLDNCLVGAIVQISVQVDGEFIIINEVGDCDNPLLKAHDGARLKDAVSDALKRCFMRLGLGLHLWAREQSFLYSVLERDEKAREAAEAKEVGSNLPDLSSEPEIEPGRESEDDEEDIDTQTDRALLIDETQQTQMWDALEDANIDDDHIEQFANTAISRKIDWNTKLLSITVEELNIIITQAARYKEQNGPRLAEQFPPEPDKPLYSEPPVETTPAQPSGQQVSKTTDPPVKERKSKKADSVYLTSPGQMAMHVQLGNYGFEKAEHYEVVSDILHRKITSFAEVRVDEQAKVYKEIKTRVK